MSWQQIQALEAPREPAPEPEPAPKVPPKFTSPLQSSGEIAENTAAHFEATLTPLDDNELEASFMSERIAFIRSLSRLRDFRCFGFSKASRLRRRIAAR